MTNSERRSEVDRLWAAVKRDYFIAVETLAGIRPDEGDRRWARLLTNWRALCAVDVDVAAQLVHGLREVSTVFDADHRGPADRHLQELDEMLGARDTARAANGAEEETFGKAYEPGEAALQRRIDEDPGHL